MRFSAVLGFVLLGSSTLIFGSDTGLRDCQISVAMADGDSLPPGLQLSVFDGERQIAELKVPKTGAMTLSQLQAGKYRIQISGTVRSFLTSGPLYVDSASPCQLGIDLAGRADASNKIAEEEVDVEDLRVSGKARSLFNDAFAAFRHGQLEKAKEGFLAVIQIDPKLARAYNVLGVIFTQQGDHAAARNSFENALQLNPNNKSALMNFAKLELVEKKYQEVLQLMERYGQGTRDIADAHAFKAEAYFRLGKFEQAVYEAHAAHALPHANGAYVHMIAAASLEALHHPEPALEEYRLYLAEARTDVNRQVALGRIRDLTSTTASEASPVPGNAFVSH